MSSATHIIKAESQEYDKSVATIFKNYAYLDGSVHLYQNICL